MPRPSRVTGRLQLVGVLAVPSGPGAPGPETSSRGRPGNAPGVPRQVAGRQPDLAALDGRAADHAGADPERSGGQVGHALEPHPHRAHERVALFLGVVPGQVGQLDAEALGVHIETVVVGLGELDHEIVRHQGAALRHDRGPVVHLPLHRASHLDGLQLGLEGAREGTLDHALEPSLEALQNSHRATSFPSHPPDRIRGAGALADRANLLIAQGGWRNGRRARFRSVCPKGREGSNPSSPT